MSRPPTSLSPSPQSRTAPLHRTSSRSVSEQKYPVLATATAKTIAVTPAAAENEEDIDVFSSRIDIPQRVTTSASKGGSGGGGRIRLVSTVKERDEKEQSVERDRQPAEFGAIPFPVQDFAPHDTWTQLGGGAKGTVYSVATTERRHRQVALKEVPAADVDTVLNEVAILRHLERMRPSSDTRHWPFMRFHSVYEWRSSAAATGHSYLLETEELRTQGYVTLSKWVDENGDGNKDVSISPPTVDERLAAGRGLLAAVSLLHQFGVAHRDLKPENVMVRAGSGGGKDDPPLIKLIDFGKACHHCTRISRMSLRGSPVTMAPELLAPIVSFKLGGDLGYALSDAELLSTDQWSLGLTVLWVLTGRRPARLFYADDDTDEGTDHAFLARENGTGITASMWKTAMSRIAPLSPSAVEFVKARVAPLLQRDPARRSCE